MRNHGVKNIIFNSSATVYGDEYDTPDGTSVRDYIHIVDLAISHSAIVHRKKQRKSLAGKQNTASKICVQIPGDGRARIQTDTTTNPGLKKYIAFNT